LSRIVMELLELVAVVVRREAIRDGEETAVAPTLGWRICK